MYFVLTVFVLINSACPLTLPSYFPKCSIDDPCISNCFVNAANLLRQKLEEGIKEIGISPIKPLSLKNFNVSHRGAGANFKARSKICVFYGLHHFKIDDIEFYPKEVLLKGVMRFGDVHVFSDYSLDGHIVGIPVTGNGFFKGLIGPSNVTFILKGDLIKIRSVQYCKLKDVQTKFEVNKFLMSFDGLQKEKGPWGDTNHALKEKSKIVAVAMTPIFDEVVKSFLEKYLRWFLKEIPYLNLFLDPYKSFC